MKRRARNNEKSGLPRAGVLSLLFHIALIIILGLSARLVITKVVPSVYRVAIMPFSSPGGGAPQGGSGVTPPAQDQPVLPAVEKTKTEGTQKPAEVVAVAQPEQKKPEQKKPEQKKEKPPKTEISLTPKKQQTPADKKDQQLAREEESDRSLQEAIDNIRLKVAIENVKKSLAEREGGGQGSGGAVKGSPQGPIGAVADGGEGSGIGSGARTGAGGGRPEDVYKGMVMTKIQQAWALSKNFPKGKGQLKTIVIVIVERDGRVQKTSLEKKSGNDAYDQMAMRAIKKAEPLPPFLNGMNKNTEVIVIGFGPD
jgi:colicin import membrane protein